MPNNTRHATHGAHNGSETSRRPFLMGQEVTVRLTDDVDGSTTAEETIVFAVDGVTYNIDLSPENAANFRRDMGEWVKHARRAGRNSRKPTTSSSGGRRRRTPASESEACRTWAKSVGIPLSERGRIPEDVWDRYRRQRDSAA